MGTGEIDIGLEINTIHHIDALDGLDMLKERSIDLVVTDPPYKVTTGGKGGGKNSKRPQGMLQGNNKLFKYQELKVKEWINKIYRVLKEGSHCYIFTNSLNLEDMLVESRKAGFKLHNLLVWKKNNMTPSQYYMKNCEYILFLRKGKAKWVNNIGGSHTVHEYKNIIGNKRHPTEKPVDLLQFYIENSSEVGDIVLDPFMGSGATAVASKHSSRKFIGFEIDEEYYTQSIERLEEES